MFHLEDALENAIRDGIVHGVVVCAKDKNGKINYSKAFSCKDVQYQEDTLLSIASLTKLVTVISALQLVEKGVISLDEDVAKLIPSLADKEVLDGFDEDGKPKTHKRRNTITLRLLLTHSAGAGYTFSDPRLERYQTISNTGLTPDGTVDGAFNFPLSYEPGEGFLYSSSLDRVGQIVEKLTGEKLEDYFRQNIWNPLGIKTATFKNKSHPPMSIRTAPNKPVEIVPNAPDLAAGWAECSGGQGLLMSMDDYIKILHSLLMDDEKVLKKETAAGIFQPCLLPACKKVLLSRMETPTWLVGDFPDTKEYDWSFGGLLVDGDGHEYRKRNTVIWSGASSCYWFIDRTAGVCGVFGTQVLPPADPLVRPLIQQFEKEVYRLATNAN